jgi:serine/threonine protein phosphatase PrpC/protein-tyrosine-phosphatase
VFRAKSIEHEALVKKLEEQPKESFRGAKTTSAGIQKPEERLNERVLSDMQFRGIVTRAVGREFHERIHIAKQDIDRFALVYSMDKSRFRAQVRARLIPLMKRGHQWESPQSRRLRCDYFESADKLFGMFDNCELNSDFFTEGAAIEIAGVPSLKMEYLEFCSAAGLVDKKPRKRKEDPAGDALFFQELFHRGERAALFGVFDGLVEARGDESKPSGIAVRILKEYVERLRDTRNSDDILKLLISYANEADSEISSCMNNLVGSTASVGVLVGKKLTYLNVGDSRIYAASFANGARVKKITTDDGVGGALEAGASMPLSDFMREAEYPYLYLGSFSQQVRGRYSGKRVFHQGFTLKSPNIGTIDLSGYDLVFGVTDGVWNQVPLTLGRDGCITEAGSEQAMARVLDGFGKRSPKEFVESLYDYAKRSMAGNAKSRKAAARDAGIVALTV